MQIWALPVDSCILVTSPVIVTVFWGGTEGILLTLKPFSNCGKIIKFTTLTIYKYTV